MLTIPVYEIAAPEVGAIKITVNDPNTPMWKGKYQTGKLALYFADVVEGKPKVPIIPIMYILTEQDIPEMNLLGYQVYAKTQDLFAIHSHIMHVIDNHYKEFLMLYKKDKEKQHELILH